MEFLLQIVLILACLFYGAILPIAASGLRTAKLIKGARLLVVKDGPHCITWTHAEQVNGGLLEFLGKDKEALKKPRY